LVRPWSFVRPQSLVLSPPSRTWDLGPRTDPELSPKYQGLLLAVINLRRRVHERSALHAGAVEREDLIERRELQRRLRHGPRLRQHLRIFDRRFHFHRVLVDAVIPLDEVEGVGVE